MKIPKYARYNFCLKRACDFIEEFHIKSLPIDILPIINQKKWGLIPYSELMEQFQCDAQTVFRCLNSKDGFTVWDGFNYTIAYNDDAKLGNRVRFTLMHEIGHIYLNHLTDFDATKIYRGSLTREENRVLENEANAFARNVLSPISMYLTLKDKSTLNVARTFGITETAAITRINLASQDVELIRNLGMSQRFMLIYRRFMNKRKCIVCNNQYFNNYTYCPICGSINSLEWGDGKMKYKTYDTDSDMRLLECIQCENEDIPSDGDFCHICGSPIVNRCTNLPQSLNFDDNNSYCGVVLPSNARYCPRCGSPSAFYEAGLLVDWKKELESATTHLIDDEKSEENTPFDDTDEELPFN